MKQKYVSFTFLIVSSILVNQSFPQSVKHLEEYFFIWLLHSRLVKLFSNVQEEIDLFTSNLVCLISIIEQFWTANLPESLGENVP